MSQNKKRLVIGVLAMVMFSLTGLSALQAMVEPDAGNVVLGPVEAPAFGNFCNNVFIQCGGFLVCPGGCHCGAFSVCYNN